MKLLMVSAFWITCASLSGAQAPHAKPTRNDTQTTQVQPKQDVLPRITLDFQPIGDGLPLSASAAFLGHPVCGADGTYYLNAIMLPKGERQVIAVSPKDKDAVSNYTVSSIMGLVNVQPSAIDADGSDLFVLAGAAKGDDLLNHDAKPGSPEARKYRKNFILHFHGKPSSPDVIPLDLPFEPRQFAATSEGKFVFLGLERTNQTPVLAVVNDSGELDHYIDTYQDFGSNKSMVAHAPQELKGQFKTMPEGAPLDFTLVAAQFVHYRGSLLLLMPGSKPTVFTIRGGSVESTKLHLPVGLEAESLVPSDTGWLVRATDGTANGKKLIIAVDPSDGEALRIIQSPQFSINDITCVNNGDFYGIHWPRDNKKNDKAFLMEAAQ
ncbi:MAG TPA: hypothetical protein VFT88_14755 [Acidobacteriaceae bacterium]|jgi:hypothetical protein|nr:hypothetical protein [Acidobacteriaceae bacterium]